MPIELNDISQELLGKIDLKRRFTLFLFDPADVELFDTIQDMSLGLKQPILPTSVKFSIRIPLTGPTIQR